MKVTGNDLIGWMESWAPRSLAESWDHPGLQVGDPRRRVTKVLISLDLTEENVDLAAREGAEMVISHHPFLFKAIRELDLRTYKGRVIEKLVKHDILSFAAHTNLDTAKGGVNDALAAALSLSDTEGLVFEQETKERKLALYVKPVTAKVLRHTLSELYGDAVNHFYLLDDEDDATDEAKLECNVPTALLASVLVKVQEICGDVHYDVYTLESHGCREYMGRIGNLPAPMSGKEALSYIKERLDIPVLRYAGNPDTTISRVAILGGAGSEFAALAKAKGADLYLTGDLKYHEAQDASRLGLLIADGGHFYTERVIVPALAKRLRTYAAEHGWGIEVIEDSRAEDIFGEM